MEMDAILAVALGGNSLGGGKFNLAGSIIGAYTICLLIDTHTLYKSPQRRKFQDQRHDQHADRRDQDRRRQKADVGTEERTRSGWASAPVSWWRLSAVCSTDFWWHT